MCTACVHEMAVAKTTQFYRQGRISNFPCKRLAQRYFEAASGVTTGPAAFGIASEFRRISRVMTRHRGYLPSITST